MYVVQAYSNVPSLSISFPLQLFCRWQSKPVCPSTAVLLLRSPSLSVSVPLRLCYRYAVQTVSLCTSTAVQHKSLSLSIYDCAVAAQSKPVSHKSRLCGTAGKSSRF